MTQRLSFSLEDYIEEIYTQVQKNGTAKVTWIADALGVKKASVTGALITLKDKNLINYEPYAPITLTKEGTKIAKEIAEKHRKISDFFINVLGISEEEAKEVACKMEHIVSPKIFDHMKKFEKFMNDCIATSPEFKGYVEKLYK